MLLSEFSMPFNQVTPSPLRGPSPVILRTDPRWFVTRGIALGLGFPLLLRLFGLGRFGLPCAIGAVLVWLLFRNATITLDRQGFRYHSLVQTVAHPWTDIECFSVVEQRMLAFITVSQYVGYNYTPSYKHYKLLAVTRGLARVVGMTHAMFKPIGFNVPAVTAVMNEHLSQSRAATLGNPKTAA